MGKKNAKKIIALVSMLIFGIAFNFAAIRYSADSVVVQQTKMDPLVAYSATGLDFVPGELLVETKGQAVISTATESTKSTPVAVKSVKVVDAAKGQYVLKLNTDEPQTSTKAVAGVSRIYANAKNRIRDAMLSMGRYAQADPKTRSQAAMTLEALDELNVSGLYESVNLNKIYKAYALPNDEFINRSGDGTTWSKSLFKTYEDMWGLKQTTTDQAWSTSTGRDVIVAVVDTGVDYEHPDLQNNILTVENNPLTKGGGSLTPSSGHVIGYNFADDNNDVMDRYGHGTHVAGTIAAVKNNHIGIAGVAPEAKIMPVKVLNDFGYGTDSSIAKGITYAVDQGAKIINMSLGGFGNSPVISQAIKYATNKNVLVVAAAGNDGMDSGVFYPAGDPGVITVAASSEKKSTTFFSNFGNAVDVAAPGGGSVSGSTETSWRDLIFNNPNVSNIVSTISSTSAFPGIADSEYGKLAGTSMAAPFVSGTAALILGQHPEYTPDQVKSVIYKSADDVKDVFADGTTNYPGWDPYTGYGIVNPRRAMSVAPSALPTAILNGKSIENIDAQAVSSNYIVRGSAAGTNYRDFKVFYAMANFDTADYYPTEWTKINDSSQQVNNNILAILNKSVITGSGNNSIVFIRLLVTSKDGITQEAIKKLMLTKNESAGFPKSFDRDIYESIPYDLNNDGKQELIYTDYTGNIRAITSTGQDIPGWKKDVGKAELYMYPVVLKNGNNVRIGFYRYDSSNWQIKTRLELFDQNGVSKKLIDVNPSDANSKLSVLKKGDQQLMVYDQGDAIKFFDGSGNLVKSIASIAGFSNTVADLDKDGVEDYIVGGYRIVLGQVRSGVFRINPKDWSIKNLSLDNARDSMYGVNADLKSGDINGDSNIEILVDRMALGNYSDKLTVLSNTGTILKTKTFSSTPSAGFFEPPAVWINDLSDVNNDNKPEIGLYNYNDGQIQYYNFNLAKVYGFDSVAAGWRAIDADTSDNYKEIVYISTLREGSAFYRGIELYQKTRKLGGQLFKQQSLLGSPYNYLMTYLPNGANSTSSYTGTWNPEMSLLHRFDYSSTLQKGWPMDGHDIRKTNNYSTP